MRDAFGFDDESWLDRAGRADASSPLGAIGGITIEERVGRGGQGVVYRGRTRTGELVAVKRLAAGSFATASMERRFEREIEAAAALAHANIVRVERREIDGDLPVLVMEWVDGGPATAWAADQRSPRDVIVACIKICDAVHHAHQRGVIHRDLKPSNVLVDRQGEPRVLDFGLAKRLDQEPDSLSGSDFIGTLSAAAPEQLTGDEVDVRTDVYALGVLFFEMLTGAKPFPECPSLAAMVDAVRTCDVPRPSSVRRGLDREIDVVLLRALAKDKAGRYQSVEALGNDLRRYLRGEPLAALSGRGFYVLRKLVRQHRAASVAVLAGISLVVASAIAASLLASRLAAARDRATTAERLRTRDWNEAWQILRFLEASLTAPGEVPEDRTVRAVLADTERRLDTDLGGHPQIAGEVRLSLARVAMRLGEFDRVEHHLLALAELVGTPAGARAHAITGLTMVARALAAKTGRDAAELHRAALRAAERLRPPRADLVARCRRNLASLRATSRPAQRPPRR